MTLIWIALISFVLLMALAIFIYQIPPDKMPKAKKSPPPAPPNSQKDWESIARRWEKNITQLNNEIDSLKKDRKALLEKIDDDKKLLREQTEQLAREKAWREKEAQAVEKVKNVDHELKRELEEVQKAVDQEHSQKLQLDRDVQEFKITVGKLNDQLRALTVNNMALEKDLGDAQKQLRDLKRENAELKKQKEDIQWVAKTDYDELKKKLKQVESDLARLSRDQKDEQSA